MHIISLCPLLQIVIVIFFLNPYSFLLLLGHKESLREIFQRFGRVVRIKKIKDYAYIHFEEREQAVGAMKALSQKDMVGAKLDISLAKPPSDKEKKDMLRRREQRMMEAMTKDTLAMLNVVDMVDMMSIEVGSVAGNLGSCKVDRVEQVQSIGRE